MKKQLQKAIDLAAYTGDKIIVVDDKNDHGTVILPLDEYERMIFGQDDGGDWGENLTGEEMLDKINREITLGKSVEGSDESDDQEETHNEDDFLTFGNDSVEDLNPSQELPPNLPVEDDFQEEEDLNDPEKEENIYYYEEAPIAPVIAEEKADTIKDEEEKESDTFTSVGEELKNRHTWDISNNIKSGAQEIK